MADSTEASTSWAKNQNRKRTKQHRSEQDLTPNKSIFNNEICINYFFIIRSQGQTDPKVKTLNLSLHSKMHLWIMIPGLGKCGPIRASELMKWDVKKKDEEGERQARKVTIKKL